MRAGFQGWSTVTSHLLQVAAQGGTERCPLSRGQNASLRSIASRLPQNGIVIADEVGMGKTRIAAVLARSVIASGGRVAILVPPGLGFQWQDELRTADVESPRLLRNLWPFLDVWMPKPEASSLPAWFERDVVLISHTFTNWHLGEGSRPWRWALLPALHAHWRRVKEGTLPLEYSWLLKVDDYEACAPRQAAEEIANFLSQLPVDHPLCLLANKIVLDVPWSAAIQPANYSRHGSMRPWLESVVGLGLGSFDLIIIDEAHKNRGDESGLSRMLDKVILPGSDSRRLAMTATPVELDASQWHQTLNRIGAKGVGISRDGEDIFQRYADACMRVRQYPSNPEACEAYKINAALFQEALSPFLLRRDKLELECVQTFVRHSGLSSHSYRHYDEITVETADLPKAWQQAVCAAEALSIVTDQVKDVVSKRLRLTMGNGHGISALLDHVKHDVERDQHQVALDGDVVSLDTFETKNKTSQRADWWIQVIANTFSGDSNPLYDHPAILAAVKEIEHITAIGEKVLVFGRFTLPLQALVTLLNARALLRALDNETPWPQAKVHEDEWTAIQAAYRQLKLPGKPNRLALNARLDAQYRALENQRRQGRSLLIRRLDASLPKGRAREVFKAFRQAIDDHDGQGESPLSLLAKVLHALVGIPKGNAAENLASAFTELIDASCEQNEDDVDADGKLSETDAAQLWARIQERLVHEYNRTEGGFARLMFGGTTQETRRLIQLAFNRPHSHPRVLVAQSVVGREGLNLHRACRTVVLLHPEWNPGVVEQQIGRVDRVGSKWEQDLMEACAKGIGGDRLPRITIRPVIFHGTYDEHNWDVLQQRWDDLRAQLHGIVISPILAKRSGLANEFIADINSCAPNFRPK